MIKVVVSGAAGKMGRETVNTILSDTDCKLVGVFDPGFAGEILETEEGTLTYSDDLAKLLDSVDADVVVDFTRPDVASDNVKTILSKGVHAVVGTTGVSEAEFKEIYNKYSTGGANLFVAPNFTTGAVLMMVFSKMAAKYFPDAEIIEFHHNNKKDAPSGTAIRTAQLIEDNRDPKFETSPGKETEIAGYEGARGAITGSVSIHAVRSNGYVASQEVIFGSKGQTLNIRHDSIERASYMPGVLLAVKQVSQIDGFVIGLENLMDI